MVKSRFVEMFLRLFLSLFGTFFPLLRLPPSIGRAEGFTRFLIRREHFVASKGRIKPAALEARYNGVKTRWETSTHRTDGLPTARVWAVGYRYVEKLTQNRRIKARAIGIAHFVTDAHLNWDVNGRPYPRHADIIGWSDTAKDVRMMAATEIANRMQLEIDPRP